MGSISSQRGWEVCARCGEDSPSLLPRVVPSYLERGVVCVCPECAAGFDSDERFARRLYPEWAAIIDTPPEERFKELFAAARMLFEEEVEAEEKIVPTLAFAAEVSAGISARVRDKESVVSDWGDPSLRSEAVSWFAYRSGGARPIKVVDGVVLLERSLRIVISSYARTHWVGVSATNDLNRSWRVLIEASLHQNPPDSGHVSQAYEDALSRGGFSQEWLHNASNICVKSREGFLRITVEAQESPIGSKLCMSPENRRKETRFPHPGTVAKLYNANSRPRKRGSSHKPKNMILACVAYYLRHFGRLEGVKEIHHLLNEHVTGEETFEEGITLSDVRRLTDNMGKRLPGRLIAESRAFYKP